MKPEAYVPSAEEEKPHEGAGSLENQFKPREINLPQHDEIRNALWAEKNNLLQQLANIQVEIELNNERVGEVAKIPYLFDTPDLGQIQYRLGQLKSVGVSQLKLGEETYDLSFVMDMVASVDTYADLLVGGTVTSKAEIIDAKLANLGITRSKLSPQAKYGFRECMKLCIEEEMLHPKTRRYENLRD